MKKIYFIRHGEAEGNVQRITQNLDTPLTEKGHEQAKIIANRVQALTPDVLFVSPYLRARQTVEPSELLTGLKAEILESVHETTPPSSLVGVSHDDERRAAYIAALTKNNTDQNWRYEDEESFNDILERCKTTYETLLSRTEEKIIVVSHGGFIKYFVAYVLLRDSLTRQLFQKIFEGLDFVENTAVTEFVQKDETTLALHTYNDRAHFAE